ncbi:MAG: OsmC family protein [Candidatus Odinarchaeota archaeon]
MKDLYPSSYRMQTFLEWKNSMGVIKGHKNDISVPFDRPAAFGGSDDHFYPDELFLGAIAACFITTFLNLIQRFDEDDFTLESIAFETRTELKKEHLYTAKEIILNGSMMFIKAEDTALIRRLIKLSRENCHLLSSLSNEIKITIIIDLTIKDDASDECITEKITLE